MKFHSAALTTILCLSPLAAQAAPLLMISVDGLRPGDVLEADKRGIKLPNLRKLVDDGAYATGVRNVLPTNTYPDHTTLITGVWPARHGIPGNVTFDPLQENMSGWYWYASDIKVPTLWDAVHQAGGRVASFSWPVSVGATSIDYNLPEYWRAATPDDMKLARALATPGLVDRLEKATGLTLAETDGENVENDLGRMKFAAALIAAQHPLFTTIHLRGFDHAEHTYGPGSPGAIAVLEQLDAGIGPLLASARQAEPGLVVAVVSDHGFAPLQHDVNLIAPFVSAGLITLDPATHKPTKWLAEPWGSASAAVVLAHPDDAALKQRVKTLLDSLAAKPELGIAHIADATEIAHMGGTPMASFWIDFKFGYEMGTKLDAPAVSPSPNKGTHGYFPTHPEMRATFIIAGPGVTRKGTLGDIDMRDIAPTLAKILKVRLAQADGHPLF